MITIVLTYRNRALQSLENCLDSLTRQTSKEFKVVLVDYGSILEYEKKLRELAAKYDFVTLIRCKTTHQLWCKSRAINIALKQCDTPCFFVGDIDMLYHPAFVEALKELEDEKRVTYLQVGFLSESESKEKKNFVDYEINFKSNSEATGMTLYPTALLKAINGYDEYYNGWGSEDTDVHVRLRNGGHDVKFYSDSILMLHQWHSKHYRKTNDLTPFHTELEQINASYLTFVEQVGRVKANVDFEWGAYNEKDYEALTTIDQAYSISNRAAEVFAFVNAILLVEKKVVIKLDVKKHKDYRSQKQKVKSVLGKKTMAFLDFEDVNNRILDCMINQLRGKAYKYQYDVKKQTISLIVKL